MSHRQIVAAILAGGLGVADLVATVRIWTTPLLERSQQILQTVLVWLIPGVFLAVRYELDLPPDPDDDPTVSPNYTRVVPPGGRAGPERSEARRRAAEVRRSGSSGVRALFVISSPGSRPRFLLMN